MLEAVAVIGLGRSFRTRKIQPMVFQGSRNFTIFGQVLDGDIKIPIGVQRSVDGSQILKISGKQAATATESVRYLPTQVIDQSCFELLDGSPKNRRQFIDWMVFHVKPEFHSVWKKYQKALKQRNSLLRHGRIARSELAPWNQSLAILAEQMDSMRSETLTAFLPGLYELISDFVAVEELSANYQRGWPSDLPFLDCLDANYERDSERRFTTLGPHRADLNVKVGKARATDILSRGQKKTLISAMKVAQGWLLKQKLGKGPLYLVDDLPAELDVKHQRTLAEWLTKLQSQVLVTGVDPSPLKNAWKGIENEQKLFHVERGTITEMEY